MNQRKANIMNLKILVGLSLFLLSFGITLNIGKITGSDVEMAKAGLEQCPRNNKTSDLIWVKNCKEYKSTFIQEK